MFLSSLFMNVVKLFLEENRKLRTPVMIVHLLERPHVKETHLPSETAVLRPLDE